ncbi:MAG: SagB/ThcOx family dehydrogenase [Candidatus Sumerlaeota bacterium]
MPSKPRKINRLPGPDFIERTKYGNLPEPSPQQQGVEPPPLELPFEGKRSQLPPAEDGAPESPLDFMELVEKRSSLRQFAQQPFSRAQLAYLLWSVAGVHRTHERLASLRTVPSAGARHALETYVLVNDVEGLEPGLYRYLALSHELGEIKTGQKLALDASRACLGQSMVADAPAAFFWAADVKRMGWRYGQRGYRYLFLDVGHACQNLYLAAESLGGGACAIAAFEDDAVNRFLEIDGTEVFAIYAAVAGLRKGA